MSLYSIITCAKHFPDWNSNPNLPDESQRCNYSAKKVNLLYSYGKRNIIESVLHIQGKKYHLSVFSQALFIPMIIYFHEISSIVVTILYSYK